MEDCNFISIDWSRMAVGNYSYVATNYIPLAGNLTGQFINLLVDNGADLNLIHLIGHRYTIPTAIKHHFPHLVYAVSIDSFGSHVCGFAGAAVASGKVARISGTLKTYFSPVVELFFFSFYITLIGLLRFPQGWIRLTRTSSSL